MVPTLTAGRRLVAVVLLAGLWLLTGGTASQAHAVLRSSDPADGASVARAPRQVTLTFTERPEPRLSTVQVLDVDGRAVQAGKAAPVAGQPFQLQVPLGALADGTYTVAWRTVSRDDGHVSGGSFAFGSGWPPPAWWSTTGGSRPGPGRCCWPGPAWPWSGGWPGSPRRGQPSTRHSVTWWPPTPAATWPGWPPACWPAPSPRGCWPPGSSNPTARTWRSWPMTVPLIRLVESAGAGWPRSG